MDDRHESFKSSGAFVQVGDNRNKDNWTNLKCTFQNSSGENMVRE